MLGHQDSFPETDGNMVGFPLGEPEEPGFSAYPEFFDGIGWDTNNANDVFGQHMIETLPSGPLNLNLHTYDALGDMSGNNEDGTPCDDGGAPVYEQLAHVEAMREPKGTLGLGSASRHGSNDKLDQDDSPRGSSKSQQTGLLLCVPEESPSPLPARRRPVRTKSLPKRLADSHMTAAVMLSHVPTSALYHGKSIASEVSSSTMGFSAQSQNDPSAVQKLSVGGKRKLGSRSIPNDHSSMVVSSKRSPQAIRATSARTETRGKPSFADLVSSGVMLPGIHTFYVGQAPVVAEVCEDGAIMYAGSRYRAVSKFALQVLRMRNPARQSCDGWKEVSWNGDKLDKLRGRALSTLRKQRDGMQRPMMEGGAVRLCPA